MSHVSLDLLGFIEPIMDVSWMLYRAKVPALAAFLAPLGQTFMVMD
jgi:hypothetical protein